MVLEKIARNLADLNQEVTISLAEQALAEGEAPKQVVLHGLLAGLKEVAKRYENNDHLYTDMYKASLIFNEALVRIKHQTAAMETIPVQRAQSESSTETYRTLEKISCT